MVVGRERREGKYSFNDDLVDDNDDNQLHFNEGELDDEENSS